jgi:hypothetical protein
MPPTKKQGRGKAFSAAELNTLFRILSEKLPQGPNEWNDVTFQYNAEVSADRAREMDHLRDKFKKLKNTRKPTGDPNIPWEVREAKKIQMAIEAKMDPTHLDDDSITYEEEGGGVNEENDINVDNDDDDNGGYEEFEVNDGDRGHRDDGDDDLGDEVSAEEETEQRERESSSLASSPRVSPTAATASSTAMSAFGGFGAGLPRTTTSTSAVGPKPPNTCRATPGDGNAGVSGVLPAGTLVARRTADGRLVPMSTSPFLPLGAPSTAPPARGAAAAGSALGSGGGGQGGGSKVRVPSTAVLGAGAEGRPAAVAANAAKGITTTTAVMARAGLTAEDVQALNSAPASKKMSTALAPTVNETTIRKRKLEDAIASVAASTTGGGAATSLYLREYEEREERRERERREEAVHLERERREEAARLERERRDEAARREEREDRRDRERRREDRMMQMFMMQMFANLGGGGGRRASMPMWMTSGDEDNNNSMSQ